MSQNNQTGFSLLEILISVIVLSFGLLSLGGLHITSVQGVNNAHSRNIASMLAMELGERMRANPKGVAGGFYGNSVSCSKQAAQCRGTQVCTSEETAYYDLQEIMCGATVDNISQGGARNLLPQGTLKVSCAGGCDQPDIAHQVTVSWGSKTIHQKLTGSTTASLTSTIIP